MKGLGIQLGGEIPVCPTVVGVGPFAKDFFMAGSALHGDGNGRLIRVITDAGEDRAVFRFCAGIVRVIFLCRYLGKSPYCRQQEQKKKSPFERCRKWF